MKLLIIYNPFSGKGNANKIEELKLELKDSFDITEFVSNGVGSITRYINNIEEVFDIIVICGGDGTANEAIGAIAKMSYMPKIAVIPLGTMNDFSKYLKMSKNIKKSSKYIKNLKTKKHFLYRANDSMFVYGFALGMLSNISYKKNKNKKLFGRLSYYFLAVKELFKSKRTKIKLEIDDKTIELDSNLLLVTSTSRIAGYRIKEKKDLTIAIFKGAKLLFPFKLLWYFITGHSKYKYVSDHFVLYTDNNEFNTDGEKNISERKIVVERYKELEFITK